MRLGLAFRVFFRTLRNPQVAERVEQVLSEVDGKEEEPKALPEAKPQPVPKPLPTRSDALTLLSVLQREARFIDFIQEPIDAYEDAQVGAAVRDIHRDSRKVLQRLFEIAPVSDRQEGAQIELPEPLDAGEYHLTGNVSGGKKSGTMVHHGWKAKKCEVPVWSGSEKTSRIIAPVEVELS